MRMRGSLCIQGQDPLVLPYSNKKLYISDVFRVNAIHCTGQGLTAILIISTFNIKSYLSVDIKGHFTVLDILDTVL
jgi:hypothetical protein